MAVTTLDFDVLLARIAQRDQEALRGLFARFATSVFSLARCIVGDFAQAEEVLQEVFLQVWRDAKTFDKKRGAVPIWLLSIARNRAIDRLRNRRRPEGVQTDLAILALGSVEGASSESDAGRVRLALAELTDVQREALLLAYFAGRTSSEIATTENTAPEAARATLADALRRLRAALDRTRARAPALDPFLFEALPLYALGDVTAEDVAAIEQILARDRAGRDELRVLTETTHQLAVLAPTAAPPPTGFDRTWKRIENGDEVADPGGPAATLPAVADDAPARGSKILPITLAATIAVALVLAAILVREWRSRQALQIALDGVIAQLSQGTQERAQQARTVEELRTQLQAARADEVVRAILAPDARLASLAPRDGSVPGVVRLLWHPGGTSWVVVGEGIAVPPLDQDLRLWGLRADQPTLAGVVAVAADGSVRMTIPLLGLLPQSDSASITLEPKTAAATAPTGPTLFTGSF